MTGILAGKRAVVTGASRGIGRGIALELARCGADVAVAYRDREGLALQVAEAIRGMGRECLAVRCDVSRPDDVAGLGDAVAGTWGGADLVINNAGIHQHLKSWELSPEDWQRVIDVNLTGVFLVSRAFIPGMMERKSGRIVNISSCVAFTGTDHEVHYAASKGGVISLTRSLALELAPHGINVNAVAPGYIETDMLVFEGVHDRQKAEASIPLGRIGKPEDIARAVRFLCSADADYITGQVLHVNGGLIMY